MNIQIDHSEDTKKKKKKKKKKKCIFDLRGDSASEMSL